MLPRLLALIAATETDDVVAKEAAVLAAMLVRVRLGVGRG